MLRAERGLGAGRTLDNFRTAGAPMSADASRRCALCVLLGVLRRAKLSDFCAGSLSEGLRAFLVGLRICARRLSLIAQNCCTSLHCWNWRERGK